MYKFICANITKSRNFTSSYKKLAQSKYLHQDKDSTNRSQAASANKVLEENADDTQEYNEEEIEGRECANPSTSPEQMQTLPIVLKLPSFKSIHSAPTLKMKEYPKFYTGNFIKSDLPTPSISKKYYHVYSINPPLQKRQYSFATSKKFASEEAKENYRHAMEHLYNIQRKKLDYQFKPMNISSKAIPSATEAWLTNKYNKKKSSKTEISYPTHTIKHNLTLSKRYKIQEGSAERKAQELEEKYRVRRKLQTKIFKSLNAKKLTYPGLVEHVKKGKFGVIPLRPENKGKAQECSLENNKPLITIIKRKTAEASPDVLDKENYHKEDYVNAEKDFDLFVKSHPTVKNASKTARMKLKARFIQLMRKSARSATKSTNEIDAPIENVAIKETEVGLANVNLQKEEEIIEEEQKLCVENALQRAVESAEEDLQIITSHPKTSTASNQKTPERDYKGVKYPKALLVDEGNNYDLENVCMRDTATRTGSGIIAKEYAKEPPKPDYKKIDQEAQELSQFVNEFKKVQLKSDKTVHQLAKGNESPGNVNVRLEELKKERLQFLKDLEQLNVTFAADNEEVNKIVGQSELERKSMPNVTHDRRTSDRIRKILTGQMNEIKNVCMFNGEPLNQKTKEKADVLADGSKRIYSTEQPRRRREPVPKPASHLMNDIWKDIEPYGPRIFLKDRAKQPVPKNISDGGNLAPNQFTNTGDSVNGGIVYPCMLRQQKLSADEINKVNVINYLAHKKEDLAEREEERADVHKQIKLLDDIRNSPMIDKVNDIQSEPVKIEENSVDSKRQALFLIREKDRLEERSEVDELNERAKERQEIYQKRKMREEDKRKRETLRDQVQSLPSVKSQDVTPRIDKVIDRLDEKVEIAEKIKNKIEQISPIIPVKQNPNPQKRKPEASNAPKDETTLDEPTKYDELNQTAENLIKNKKILDQTKGFALDQPSPKEHPHKIEKCKIQENLLKEEQAKKNKKNMSEFYHKKRVEWGQVKCQPEKSFDECKAEQVINIQQSWGNLKIEQGLNDVPYGEINKEKVEVMLPAKYIEEKKSIMLLEGQSVVEGPSPDDQNDCNYKEINQATDKDDNKKETKEKTKDSDVNEEHQKHVKEEHYGGHALYPTQHKIGSGLVGSGGKNEPMSQHEEIYLPGSSNKSPITNHFGPALLQAAVDNTKQQITPEKHSKNCASPSQDLSLDKQTDHLQEAVKSMVSKKMVSPCIQKSIQEVRGLENYPLDEANALRAFRDQILDDYFESKSLPGSQQIIYMPKERLIVNNIKEVDDNRSIYEEHKELSKESNAMEDTAVLRPGDEIVILEKNVISEPEGTKQELMEVKKSLELITIPEKATLDSKPLDKARSELAACDNLALIETQSRVDQMIQKIKDLETMLKKQEQTLIKHEKKSENKPRIAPPQPPTGKDNKNIKKDKPKGLHDMVLPPKKIGHKPEKSPKEHRDVEVKSIVKKTQGRKTGEPDKAQSGTAPDHQPLPIISHPISKKKQTGRGDDLTKALQDFIKQEKLDQVPASSTNSIIKNKPKNNSATKKASTYYVIDDDHEKKVRKYFATKFGQGNNKPSNNDGAMPTVYAKSNVAIAKKILKAPKSKSVTATAVELEQETKENKWGDGKSKNVLSRPKKSASTLDPKNKIIVKSCNNRQMSCPPAFVGAPKLCQSNKPMRSSSNDGLRAVSCPPKTARIGMEEKKTKYSSWSMHGRLGHQIKSNSGNTTGPKKIASKEMTELCWPLASDTSSKFIAPKKPKVILNPDLFNKSTGKDSSKVEAKSCLVDTNLKQKSPKPNQATPDSQQEISLLEHIEIDIRRYSLVNNNSRPLKQAFANICLPNENGCLADNNSVQQDLISEPAKTLADADVAKDNLLSEPPKDVSKSIPENSDSKEKGLPQAKQICGLLSCIEPTKSLLSEQLVVETADKNLSDRKPILEMLKSPANENMEPVFDSPKAFPKMFWPDETLDSKPVLAEKKSKNYKSVIELYRSKPTSPKVEQGNKTLDSPKALPKVFWPEQTIERILAKDNLKKQTPIKELGAFELTDYSFGKKTKVSWIDQESSLATKTPKQTNPVKYDGDKPLDADNLIQEKHISKPSKQDKPILKLSKALPKSSSSNNEKEKHNSEQLPKSCEADDNLRRNKPIGVLKVVLPKSHLVKTCNSRSPAPEGTRPVQKMNLNAYSSDTKVLRGKRNLNFANKMDLDNAGNKVLKAGISTTPTIKKLSDKHFSGPRRSIDQVIEPMNEGKSKQKIDRDKKAIFRIQYDGEVFIIKKADESFVKKKDVKRKPVVNNSSKHSKDHVDAVKETSGSKVNKTKRLEPISNVEPSNQTTNETTADLVFKNQKFVDWSKDPANELPQSNKPVDINNEPDELKVQPAVNFTQYTSNDDPDGAQNTKPKLMAKVKQIIVKPVKEESKKEGTKEHKSEIILNSYDKAEDKNLSYIYQSSVVFQKAFLKAKIETIYDKDSSSKIREDQKLRKFNRFLISDTKPKKWKPLYSDLGAANFQRTKDDFFEHGLKEDFISPRSTMRSDAILKKHTPKRKLENVGFKRSPSESKVKDEQEKLTIFDLMNPTTPTKANQDDPAVPKPDANTPNGKLENADVKRSPRESEVKKKQNKLPVFDLTNSTTPTNAIEDDPAAPKPDAINPNSKLENAGFKRSPIESEAKKKQNKLPVFDLTNSTTPANAIQDDPAVPKLDAINPNSKLENAGFKRSPIESEGKKKQNKLPVFDLTNSTTPANAIQDDPAVPKLDAINPNSKLENAGFKRSPIESEAKKKQNKLPVFDLTNSTTPANAIQDDPAVPKLDAINPNSKLENAGFKRSPIESEAKKKQNKLPVFDLTNSTTPANAIQDDPAVPKLDAINPNSKLENAGFKRSPIESEVKKKQEELTVFDLMNPAAHTNANQDDPAVPKPEKTNKDSSEPLKEPGYYETMYLNRKYAAMLRKIENRLAADRKSLEIKTDKIRKVTSILDQSAAENSSVTVDKQKQQEPEGQKGESELKDYAKHDTVQLPSKCSLLLKKVAKSGKIEAVSDNKSLKNIQEEKANNKPNDFKVARAKKDKPSKTSLIGLTKSSKISTNKIQNNDRLTYGSKRAPKAENTYDSISEKEKRLWHGIDPFKDIPYYGTIKFDCVDKPKTPDQKTKEQSRSLYTLNVPLNDRNKNTGIEKATGSLYILKTPKLDETENKHDGKRNMKSVQDNTKLEEKISLRSKSESVQYKLKIIDDPKRRRSEKTTTTTLMPQESKLIKKVTTTIKPSAVKEKKGLQSKNNTKESAKIDVVQSIGKNLRQPSVEKMVSKENLATEIQAWISNVSYSRVDKIAAKDVQETVIEAPLSSPIENPVNAFKAQTGQMGKDTNFNQPEKNNIRNADDGKYQLEKDDPFPSVEKSFRKRGRKVKTYSPKTPQEIRKPNTLKIRPMTPMDKMVEAGKRKDVQRKVKKSREEQKAKQIEKRFKKDKVDEINNTAAEIIRNQQLDAMFKGSQRKQKYQEDTEVIGPSVGSRRLGNKFKKPTSLNDDKKNLHSKTNDNNTPSKEQLLSKSEFLRLKKLQAQQTVQNLKAPAASSQNLAPRAELKLSKSTGKANTTKKEAVVDLKMVGDEIEKYRYKLDKTNTSTAKSVQQFRQGAAKEKPEPKNLTVTENIRKMLEQENIAKSKIDLHKRIEQEIETKVKLRPDLPRPEMSSDTLTFKITKMTKLIADDMRLGEERKEALEKGTIPKPNTTNTTVNEKTQFGKPLERSSPEARNHELDKMVELKRKNKRARLLKSTSAKRMFRHETTLADQTNVESVKTDNKRSNLDLKTDKEETGPNINKGANFIFKPENLRPMSKRKSKNSAILKDQPPLSLARELLPKPHCKTHILPMKNLKSTIHETSEPYASTLDKPVGAEIKVIPKHILDIDGQRKKTTKLFSEDKVTNSDPLAKYRHLKITYMTVSRPVKKEDEKFLPDVQKMEEGEPSEMERHNIINYRFELLKRLSNEFRQQLAQQSNLPDPDAHITPMNFDGLEPKDVKIDLERRNNSSNKEGDMNISKILGEAKPVLRTKNIPKPKCGSGKNTAKNVFGSLKTDDDNNGRGGVRRYSTDSDKCVGSDNNTGGECLGETHEKTDVCKVIMESTRAPSTRSCENIENEVSETCDNIKKEVSDCSEDFDITEAVPHAFECASPRLEEERQKELYYRYHQMTFLDLHQYLGQKRVFAIEAAEKKRREECEIKESNKSSDCE